MLPDHKSDDSPARSTTDTDLDGAAVAEFTHRLQRAVAVRKRGQQCATVSTCDGCPLVCALWFPTN